MSLSPRYCARCGSPTSQRVPTGDDRARAVCGRCGMVHYDNPKIIVGSVCTLGQRLLICRRAIEPRRGYWTIPAGFMELGETAEEGAAREAFEEATARIRIDSLLAVYSLARIGQVQLHYSATLLDLNIGPGYESLEVSMIRWDEIPWQDLAFPSVHWVLREAMRRRGETRPSPPATQPPSDG